MSLLRNIGNRLRRGDDSAECAPPPTFNAKPPAERAPVVIGDESPDLYFEDRALGHSIHGLEEVRLALRDLTAAANAHKESLIASATTERALGAHLVDMMYPRGAPPKEDDDEEQLDFENETETTRTTRHFSRFLRAEDVEAQKVLGKGLTSHSESTVKLANAMSNPINELERSFEERFSRKIVPLRRRYVDQKGQYLKYKKHSDMADNDEKRSYYEALAEAAKPVWLRTSTELRTESDVMTELTARNMAKWSRSLALQHERALAIAAANFADAFQRAKANNMPPRSDR